MLIQEQQRRRFSKEFIPQPLLLTDGNKTLGHNVTLTNGQGSCHYHKHESLLEAFLHFVPCHMKIQVQVRA